MTVQPMVTCPGCGQRVPTITLTWRRVDEWRGVLHILGRVRCAQCWAAQPFLHTHSCPECGQSYHCEQACAPAEITPAGVPMWYDYYCTWCGPPFAAPDREAQ